MASVKMELSTSTPLSQPSNQNADDSNSGNLMIDNGGPITGCLIRRVTKYTGYKDVCIRFSFPVLAFCKEICHSNRIRLGIPHFGLWLQPNST